MHVRFKKPEDHCLHQMRQASWRTCGPILPFQVIYLPFSINGSRTEKKNTLETDPVTALYCLMLKLPPHNPQTRKVMPVRVSSLIVSTFINNIFHLRSSNTQRKGGKAKTEDPCQLSSQDQDFQTKSQGRLAPLGVQGFRPLWVTQRKEKPREQTFSILWCCLVSV